DAAGASAASGERACLREVRSVERIDVDVPKAGQGGREVLVGGKRRIGPEDPYERAAVDREVESLAQLDVVPERRAARVDQEHLRDGVGLDEQARLVHAVAPDEPRELRGEVRSRGDGVEPSGGDVADGGGVSLEVGGD